MQCSLGNIAMQLVSVVLLLLQHFAGEISCNIDHLELVMPRYAIKGGDVILKCEHSVPSEQLYKVEWQKGGNKIFQYIKGRRPPFRMFGLMGATFNKEKSSDKQLYLSNLDFSASGAYSCQVSIETPIFTKDSQSKDLIVIDPQKSSPKIVLHKTRYEMGEILRVNCTTSAARPPPHVTWLINGEKVLDTLTRTFSDGMAHRSGGHGYFEQRASSIKQLTVAIGPAHISHEDDELELTCMATIPGYVSRQYKFADVKNTTVKLKIHRAKEAQANRQNLTILANRVANRRIYEMLIGFNLLLVLFIS